MIISRENLMISVYDKMKKDERDSESELMVLFDGELKSEVDDEWNMSE